MSLIYLSVLRACAKITSHFRIPSSGHLCPILNHKVLEFARGPDVAAQTASILGLQFPLLSDPQARGIRLYQIYNLQRRMAHVGYVLIDALGKSVSKRQEQYLCVIRSAS